MIVANIILNLVEDKHVFTDEEQCELMDRLKRLELLLIERAASDRADGALRTAAVACADAVPAEPVPSMPMSA